jgi:hypothetical protein
MGDIEHPGDTILEAQPHRDQGINAAQQQAGDQDIENDYKHGESFLERSNDVCRLSKGLGNRNITPPETACMNLSIIIN